VVEILRYSFGYGVVNRLRLDLCRSWLGRGYQQRNDLLLFLFELLELISQCVNHFLVELGVLAGLGLMAGCAWDLQVDYFLIHSLLGIHGFFRSLNMRDDH
jgi:hypothetical protein